MCKYKRQIKWSLHAYGHDVADKWLLKDDTEANEVMESDKWVL